MRSSIEALRQAQSSMETPKQQAEELSTRFQGMGADSLAVGAEGLRNGVEQAQGMVPDVVTQLEQLITDAQGLKTTNPAGLPGASTTHTRPPPTPLDAAPPDLKEPTAKVGDPVKAVEQPDDGGAFERLLRRADDVHDATKATSQSVQNIIDSMRGPKPTHVGTGDAGPLYQGSEPPTGKPDPVLFAAMGSLVVARAIQLYRKRRKDKGYD